MSGIMGRSRAVVSLMSKSHRHLCSNPNIQSSNPPRLLLHLQFSVEKWRRFLIRKSDSIAKFGGMHQNKQLRKRCFVVGTITKFFSSIVENITGLTRAGEDKAGNSYFSVSGERWLAIKRDTEFIQYNKVKELRVPVEWLHWLLWKRNEAPTPKEINEQEATHKIFDPVKLLHHDARCPEKCFQYRLNAISLSKDAMFFTIEGILCEDPSGQSMLFSVKKKIGKVEGFVHEISVEFDIDCGIVFSLGEVIDKLATPEINALIREKLEGVSDATRSPDQQTGVVTDNNDDGFLIFADDNSIFCDGGRVFDYFTDIFYFLVSRATGNLSSMSGR